MKPRTSRGRRTRERILESAARLIHRQGVAATSVDQVLAESAAGKSQFYHYFDSKDDLVRAVLRWQMERSVFEQMPHLRHLDSWHGIQDWFERLVSVEAARSFVGGCPVGSMAAEMADRDESLRTDLVQAFRIKGSHLARGLERMKARGELREDCDPDDLARFVTAVVQGGLLLAATEKSPDPLRRALEHAYEHLRSYALAPAPPVSSP